MYDSGTVKGGEFKRKVEKLARRKGLACIWDPAHGKGSHGTLYVGSERTRVKDLKAELGYGLFKTMCDPLRLDHHEVEKA